MRTIFLLIFISTVQWVSAQMHFSSQGGAYFNGLGRAGLSVEGIGAMYYNQAGISSVKNWAVDVSFERRFNLADLTAIQVSGVKKVGKGAFGLLFSQFGTEVFNEQMYGLAYGRQLNKIVSLGGQLSVLGFNGQNLGSLYTVSFAMGTIVKLNRQFLLASHVFSPFQVAITENNEIATRLRFGITYLPSKKVSILAEIDKNLNRKPWEYKLGISYQVVEPLWLQIGFNPTAEFYAFGLRYSVFNKWNFRGSASVHQILGLTPSVSLSYGE
jgi:hypothetical protein